MQLPQILLCCSSSRWWLDLDRIQIVWDHDLQIHKLNALNRSRTNNMEDESWKKHQPKFEKQLPNLQTLERTRHFTLSWDRFFLLPGSLCDLKVWEVSTAEGAWMRGAIKLPSKSCSSVRVKSTNFDEFKPRSENNCSTSIGKESSKRGSKGQEEQRTGEEQKNENRMKNQEIEQSNRRCKKEEQCEKAEQKRTKQSKKSRAEWSSKSVSCRLRFHLDNQRNWWRQVEIETWTSCVPLGLCSNLGKHSMSRMLSVWSLRSVWKHSRMQHLTWFSSRTAQHSSSPSTQWKIIKNIK